jgi:hypothetical protein
MASAELANGVAVGIRSSVVSRLASADFGARHELSSMSIRLTGITAPNPFSIKLVSISKFEAVISKFDGRYFEIQVREF